MNLTDHQTFVLSFIRGYQARELTSPTIREIAEFLRNKSMNSTHKTVHQLVRAGALQLDHRGRIRFPNGTLVPQAPTA